MTQSQRVLEAFLAAPGRKLTTAQIDSIPFMTNQRARISDLRKLGHVFHVERIEGKHQSVFTYMGHLEPVPYVPDVKAMQWHPLPNSFEVLY